MQQKWKKNFTQLYDNYRNRNISIKKEKNMLYFLLEIIKQYIIFNNKDV